MKTKLLLILSLVFPSLCFGKVTFIIHLDESDSAVHISMKRYDSVSKTIESTSPIYFELESLNLIKNAENQANLDKFFAYLDKYGLSDHIGSKERRDRKITENTVGVFGSVVWEHFLLSGYTVDFYETIEKGDEDSEIIQNWVFSKN
jgi:hypothetical protein